MQQLEHEALVDIRDGLAQILVDPDPTAAEYEKTAETLAGLHDLADAAIKDSGKNRSSTLVKKLVAVMQGVKRIPKRASVNQGEGAYDAVAAADVFDAVRELMAEQGVLLIGRPRQTEVVAGCVVVRFDFEWTDGDDALLVENVVVRVLENTSESDKGIQSSYTIAHKLVLMNQFLISTGPAEEDKEEVAPGTKTVAGKLISVRAKGPEDDRYWQLKVDQVELVCKDSALAKELAGIVGAEVSLCVLKLPSSKFARALRFTPTTEVGRG